MELWVSEGLKQKLLNEAQGKVTFNDVAGVGGKRRGREIVDFLKDPKNLVGWAEKFLKERF